MRALFLLLVLSYGFRIELPVERHLWWIQSSAWVAIVYLAATLAGPLYRFGISIPGQRRDWGLATWLAASTHAGLAYGLGLAENIAWEPQLRAGAGALLLLTALAATSFRWRVPAWKVLHQGVYLAALLILLHAAQAPRIPWGAGIALLGAAAVLAGIRVGRAKRQPERDPG